ncbi:hypothetical protein PI124_g18956 [Phytophthora idaei]|nr:hypothetical protein PI125_g20555 [Phytophthora idaei]KAG3132551.1 hypothetical protein PI126_g19588 [Phytophthora idaei]KAG3236022.1 hypothetical protein PI124_g18956 [Phytophthora idaei]
MIEHSTASSAREDEGPAPSVIGSGDEKANNLPRALTPVVRHMTKDLPRAWSPVASEKDLPRA